MLSRHEVVVSIANEIEKRVFDTLAAFNAKADEVRSIRAKGVGATSLAEMHGLVVEVARLAGKLEAFAEVAKMLGKE